MNPKRCSIYAALVLNLAILARALPVAAQAYTGDIILTTQAAVDTFASTFAFTEIAGTLEIRGPALTSVDGLAALVAVGGNLVIADNAALTNVNGLAALASVGGNVSIRDNAALRNIDGLAALASVGERLLVSNNAALANVDGLAALTSVGGSLIIDNNGALANVSGLAALASVGGSMHIRSNAALAHVDGLAALASVGGSLHITGNAALTDVDGLAALSSVGGSLHITSNAALANVDGLAALASVGASLAVVDNAALSLCDCGLFHLINSGGVAGRITIRDNAQGCNSPAEVTAPAGTCRFAVATENPLPLPNDFALVQNYPNPFNSLTTIRFTVPRPQHVTLTVYDALGRRVAVVVESIQAAGEHTVPVAAGAWSSGVYVYRLETEDFTQSRQMLLLK